MHICSIIVNASIALRNENYAEAKEYIDEAYETESTSNEPKMWNYRALIYLQIALKEPALDKDAAFKANTKDYKYFYSNIITSPTRPAQDLKTTNSI